MPTPTPDTTPPPAPASAGAPASARTSWWRRFLLPTLNRPFLIRLAVTAVIAWIFFGHICIPARIHGDSMHPTYKNRAFLFCWRPRYWLVKPKRGDVVMLKIAGRKVMLLKRVVALPGDTVAFRHGVFLLNGEEPEVPWARTTECDWDLEPRTVKPGHAYVVGDNRTMLMEQHEFGEIAIARIAGAPVW